MRFPVACLEWTGGFCVSIGMCGCHQFYSSSAIISFRKKVQSTAQLTKEGNIGKIEHRNFILWQREIRG
jgi:hypothetical protein